ncbi:hypothetical protein TRIATDRAFT_317055 [Trichoderma atroviride IMI 206040]|uniref:Uncharacterized protein n=1 Tax=Hypocrea atroviridis (strain ATCC 20476 / IMI 206040) TaxID=452589 RepID=G9NPV3_HYPAI|nr:uncharacterized protein TRIATDRAFT_317055 [Trichoderma atroviride IMI 206040]EHK47106.1 hypothetical protein TRIATDRAFT_317055 [Trichoderma atroviride IMI 206040]
MPPTKKNASKKNRGNENPAPAQPPAKKVKMPPKGTREQKLEHLRLDLRDIIKKELDVAKQKQFVLDRIEHWKNELDARPEDKDADALADALFDKIVKGGARGEG